MAVKELKEFVFENYQRRTEFIEEKDLVMISTKLINKP